MSADPTVEAPFIPQDLNRYSYAGNNPLSFTDTSGLCFLGCFFKSSIFRAIASIAAAAILQEVALPLIEGELGLGVSATVNAGISGGMSGFISTGKLKGALIQGVEAVAFAGLHFAKSDVLGFPAHYAQYSAGQIILSAGAHGLVGGLASIAGGGKFGSGFLAAAFADTAGAADMGSDASVGGIVSHAVTGGIGSVIGGGKFANGAITGAFGYLFNAMVQRNPYGSVVTGDRYVDETTELLCKTVQQALDTVGPGSGPIYGTRVHLEFASLVEALGRPDLHVEISFNGLGPTFYGDEGSIRIDVLLGQNRMTPAAIYDLKTGNARLPQSRVNELLAPFPIKPQGGVIVIRPTPWRVKPE